MIQFSVKEISKRLAERAETVCSRLLPGGKREKSEWKVGDLSGNPGKSLSVHLEGPHAGKWRDWASDADKGDLVDLWRSVRGLSASEAIREAKEFLGIAEPVRRHEEKTWTFPEKNGCGPLDPNGKAMHFLIQKRKLNAEIVNRFRVEGDRAKNAIVFPSFSPQGILINRSFRTLPADGEKKKVWQESGCAPCLFGWQALDDGAFLDRTILLCEGQIDAMTWTQWGVAALSIPNGSGQTWIEYEWDNLAPFDTIYIAFDMDGPGAENARKAVQRLGKHRCLMVKLPEKDANDCLMAGFTAKDAGKWIGQAAAPEVKGLVIGVDMERRVIADLAPKPEAFTLPFFRIKWPWDGLYFRPYEVTVWTGVNGNGKSTFLRYLALSLIGARSTCFFCSLEAKVEREIIKMVTFISGADATPEAARAFLQKCGPFLIFADVTGTIGQEMLFEMMWFSFQRYGASTFFIDSMMRIESLEEDNIAQGAFLGRLQGFAKQTGAHVHLVCHPRKTEAGGKPTKMDVKGSSLIQNNADNIVLISRNHEKDRLRHLKQLTLAMDESMHDAEIRVEKQRDSGWEGSYFLRFDRKTGSYGEMPETYVPAEPKPTKKTKARKDIDA